MTTKAAQRTSDSPAGSRHGSEAVTHGLRVRVAPAYLERHSSRVDGKFVFAYRITITNEGERRVRLASRRWIIIDGCGRREEVSGEGVVGQHPVLDPGESFEYTSTCVLQHRWGTMEGSYLMHPETGEPFEAEIARFYLVAPAGCEAGALAQVD